MDDDRIQTQAILWEMNATNQKPGSSRTGLIPYVKI